MRATISISSDCYFWRQIVLLAATVMAAGLAFAAEPGTQRRFQGAQEWAQVFDDPSRDAWQKPDEVIRALALPKNAVLADVGAGTGYFAVRLARAVPAGRVYGADIEPDMVRYLEKRAQAEGLANLSAVQATREGPTLPEPVDLALFVNVQGLMVNPGGYFARLRASLKPGGRVAIIAWKPESAAGAPKPMRVSAEQIKRDMAQQGYGIAAEYHFLPNQHFIVFQPR